MKKQSLSILLIFATLLSCNQSHPQNNSQSNVNQKDTSELSKNSTDSVSSSGVECIRGAAEPIINKTVFPNTVFNLQKDKITGIETVNFDNGDQLIIKNWGCEYYCLTFRFETSRFQEDTSKLQFWFKKSVALMSEILKGINSPSNIKKGIDSLSDYIQKKQLNSKEQLKLGEEIDFGGEDIREYVYLDRIQRIDSKKYAIEISFVTGPL